MRIITLIVLYLVLGGIHCYSRVITVDNKYPSIGDFTNLLDAVQNSHTMDGDTIYVCPSQVAYQGISNNKRLIIIGSGWDENIPGSGISTINGEISFVYGSNGSKIMGFSGGFGIIVNSDNIVVSKNILAKIAVEANHHGTIISQNNIWKQSSDYCIIVSDHNELTIMNNILRNSYMNGDIIGHVIYASGSAISITIKNNYIKASDRYFWGIAVNLDGANSYVYNNYFEMGVCIGNGFFYNMACWSILPSCCNNQNGIFSEDVFKNPGIGDFRLLDNSIAKGAGLNGEDIGIYGGDTPYIDGGYPGIPLIYNIEYNFIGTKQNGLKVKFKAKSNKD